MYQVDFEEFAISMESYMISEYDIGTYDIGTEGKLANAGKAIWDFICRIGDWIKRTCNNILNFLRHPIQHLKAAGKWIKDKGWKNKKGAVGDGGGATTANSSIKDDGTYRLTRQGPPRPPRGGDDDTTTTGGGGRRGLPGPTAGGGGGPTGGGGGPTGGGRGPAGGGGGGGTSGRAGGGTGTAGRAGGGGDGAGTAEGVPPRYRDIEQGIIYVSPAAAQYVNQVNRLQIAGVAQALIGMARQNQIEGTPNGMDRLIETSNVQRLQIEGPVAVETKVIANCIEETNKVAGLLTGPVIEDAPEPVQQKAKAMQMATQKIVMALGRVAMQGVEEDNARDIKHSTFSGNAGRDAARTDWSNDAAYRQEVRRAAGTATRGKMKRGWQEAYR